MVIVEGVARSLDPRLNLWTAAEPIAREWVEQNYGLPGRLRDAGESTELLVKVLAQMPRVLEQGETAAQAFAQMAQNGLRLDDETIRKLAAEEAGYGRASRAALWVGAVALVMMAFAIWVWGS